MTWLRQAFSILGAARVASEGAEAGERVSRTQQVTNCAARALLVTKDSRDQEAQPCFCCQLGPRGASSKRNILAKTSRRRACLRHNRCRADRRQKRWANCATEPSLITSVARATPYRARVLCLTADSEAGERALCRRMLAAQANTRTIIPCRSSSAARAMRVLFCFHYRSHCVRPPNGSEAKLRGRSRVPAAERRGGCSFRAALAPRESDVGRRAAGLHYRCGRRFSAGPKPGRASFSFKLARAECSRLELDIFPHHHGAATSRHCPHVTIL